MQQHPESLCALPKNFRCRKQRVASKSLTKLVKADKVINRAGVDNMYGTYVEQVTAVLSRSLVREYRLL